MIRHVISWKFIAEDRDEKDAAFAELAEGFGPLPHLIPEIRTLHLGRDIDYIEGNWDVVLIVDFASTADLDAYIAHPEHQKVVTTVRRLTNGRTAIDFEL